MPKLYYCYDALCGWCYGFSPVITKFHEHHPELPIRVVSGGMITGERIGPIGEVVGYIKQAYKVVEERCGVTFGPGFLRGILDEGTAVFTSLPAAVAMTIFREERPDEQLAFAAELQRAIYYDGIRPLDDAAYGQRASKFGLDGDKFLENMAAAKYVARAEDDFRLSRGFGVVGFPTVLYEDGDGQSYALARGYVSPDQLERTYAAVAEGS
jgi:putative protein-disulfide isomerase